MFSHDVAAVGAAGGLVVSRDAKSIVVVPNCPLNKSHLCRSCHVWPIITLQNRGNARPGENRANDQMNPMKSTLIH